jgi:hypothetical protein
MLGFGATGRARRKEENQDHGDPHEYAATADFQQSEEDSVLLSKALAEVRSQ